MPSIDTFLQTAYQFIKALFVRVTKRMYRTAAVLMTGQRLPDGDSIYPVSFMALQMQPRHTGNIRMMWN